MDLRAKTCCFTGHRSLSGEEKLKAAVRLRRVIEEQIKAGIVFYGAGGARGFDSLAAQTVLEMKKEHPQLRLILVLPCEGQTRGWRSEDIAVYEDIKRRSDKVVYVSREYTPDCMHRRNRHLVPDKKYRRNGIYRGLRPKKGAAHYQCCERLLSNTAFQILHSPSFLG